MRKLLLPLSLCGAFIFSTAQAQVQKKVLFEHFTQASCGPCAQQNPGFKNNILANNFGRIHHISVHTSWPGTDPMYNYNTQVSGDRVSYYGVSGVPRMIMLGNQYEGGPAGVTQAMVNDATSETSPLRVRVKETSNGTSRDVTVTVHTVGTAPTGNLKLRAAVVEAEINYTNPPGNNGEKYFPNVLRDYLPNEDGQTYTPAVQGDSVVFNFNYTLDQTNWDTTQIYVIAFVQNESDKEVLQSGSSWDSNWEFASAGGTFEESTTSNTKSFDVNYNNLGGPENFEFELISDQPTGWSADFEYNSNTFTTTTTDLISANTNGIIKLNVTPGATAGIGEYTISMKSLDDPSFAPVEVSYYVISGVTDLIVNNEGGWGDGGNYDFSQHYIDGLNSASNTSFASTSNTVFFKGAAAGKVSMVRNIYYNVSWTFPSFTDETAALLSDFLENDGKMFVAGQDIGWDTWDGSGNGTSITKAFYTNYLNTSYVNDGTSARNQYNAVSGDEIFENVATSSLIDLYSGNMYPDKLAPVGLGEPIFHYNNTADIGGIRAVDWVKGYKVVYLGVDLSMIADASVREEIVKLSHDWFYNIVSTEEFDAKMQAAMGQSFPNPGNGTLTIPLQNISNNMTLQVTDVTGRLVLEKQVKANATSIAINSNNLQTGVYNYSLYSEQKIIDTKRLQVVR